MLKTPKLFKFFMLPLIIVLFLGGISIFIWEVKDPQGFRKKWGTNQLVNQGNIDSLTTVVAINEQQVKEIKE